jgi:fusion protein PurCD
MTLEIALFGSGNKCSSIKFVLNNFINTNSIKVTDVVITSNCEAALVDERTALKEHVRFHVIPNESINLKERSVFEDGIKSFWSDTPLPNVVMLLGWNFILTDNFLDFFRKNNCLVLNMHPALPDSFVGANAIHDTFKQLQAGEMTETGSMIHVVTPNLDRGAVLGVSNVQMNSNYFKTEEELREVIKMNEKPLISSVVNRLINEYEKDRLGSFLTEMCVPVNKPESKYTPFYRGKVRQVTDIGNNLLLLTASNRISAFNKHLCEVPDKGRLLNDMSAWWFRNTSHIIPNHFLFSHGTHMVAKRCQPIMLEIIVRAYMTGSSDTSIWTKYNAGERQMYGLAFRDGYKKNQVLDNLVITPTTKGEVDEPITREQIIVRNYLTERQIDYIYSKATELFKFGQVVAAERGLILVDTKYEFGFINDEIVLMDEIHTCDSSRYWLRESYQDKFAQGLEPEKFDKDCIRDYVKSNYSLDEIRDMMSFNIPDNIVAKVNTVYTKYHQMLTNNDTKHHTTMLGYSDDGSVDSFVDAYYNNYHNELVVILAGSTSDREHVEKIKKNLADYSIHSVEYYKSAHKNTLAVMNILQKYHRDVDTVKRKIVFVTVAGRSNALSGVVASNVRYPVIACPPFKDKMDMFTNINSSLQCPSKVPVMTVLEPQNVAIATRYMFDM